MCVGTYLGSLVLSQTLSYSYQNIFFTRQNWLFTLAIKLILKKQEKNMPLNWHFFNFIFIGCFFFRIICVSCLHEICNTFQSIQVEKKKSHKNCQNLGFSSKNFFWPEWIFLLVKTMCACIKSKITAPGCARLCHIWPNLTRFANILRMKEECWNFLWGVI